MEAWARKLAFGGALLVTACSKVPPGKSAVQSVRFDGVHKIDSSDIEDAIATNESPRFLGLFPGVVYDYVIFDPFVLQRDLERVERLYRARGYYDAHARAARIEQTSNDRVRVTIVVDEGQAVRVRSVALRGTKGLPSTTVDAVNDAITALLPRGAPLDEDAFAKSVAAAQRALTDRGFAYAKATREAEVDLPNHAANLLFTLEPGPQARLGKVTVDGLGKLPEAPVRRALDLREGELYSTADLDSARRAVLQLGVFGLVEIVPDLSAVPPEGGEGGAAPRVAVRVRVEPSKLRTLSLGGGFELDSTGTDIHLVVGWENRNLFGGLRNFRARVRPGLVLYPTRIADGGLKAPTDLLPEIRTSAELRQPGLFEARTNGLFQMQFNVYSVLLNRKPTPDDSVLGYREILARTGLSRIFGRFYVNPLYNIQFEFPFAYKGELDSALRNVVISYLGLFVSFDHRDNPVRTRRGYFFGADLQYAGGFLGGDTHDVRVQPEARGYLPLSKYVTLAARATVGFLFPFNYGASLAATEPISELSPAQLDESARDEQLVYFRAFFSGGPNSNRGYALRGVGPQGVVPYFNPALTASQFYSQCNTSSTSCIVPLGGFSLWEASLEARITISGPFSTVFFCDASDVSPNELQLRFDRPHLSCGPGARYDTPVGPVRLDFGYRIPGAQTFGPDIPPSSNDPPTIFGIPIAVSFGIGESF